jgi:hypothetical protein
MRFLAIDPSMNRIGWAVYDTDASTDFNYLANWNFGFRCPPGQGKVEKLIDIKSFFAKSQADHLICEVPAFFDSEKGRIAAKLGYTNDLTLVIGTIYGSIPDTKLFLYTPQQWKGSTPKEITLIRFRKAFTDSHKYDLMHDIVDAIMILRYHVILISTVLNADN